MLLSFSWPQLGVVCSCSQTHTLLFTFSATRNPLARSPPVCVLCRFSVALAFYLRVKSLGVKLKINMRCCTVCCTRCCYLPVLVTPLAPLMLLCRWPPWAALQLSLEQKQIDISTLSAAAAAAEAWAICTSAFIAHTQQSKHSHTH